MFACLLLCMHGQVCMGAWMHGWRNQSRSFVICCAHIHIHTWTTERRRPSSPSSSCQFAIAAPELGSSAESMRTSSAVVLLVNSASAVSSVVGSCSSVGGMAEGAVGIDGGIAAAVAARSSSVLASIVRAGSEQGSEQTTARILCSPNTSLAGAPRTDTEVCKYRQGVRWFRCVPVATCAGSVPCGRCGSSC